MQTFQIIDDKNNCFGVYSNGEFIYDRVPNTFSRTFSWSKHHGINDIDYAFLYGGGRRLVDLCPENLKERFEIRERKIKAFVNSFINAKIDIENICLFDIVPTSHLRHYLEIKNKICDFVFANSDRPTNYNFLKNTYQTINEIALQSLRIDWKLLESLALKDMKAKSLLKRIKGSKSFVKYDLFGTKTGRLSIKEGSFPILNLKTENKGILIPKNDWFVEFDYNGAEIRTLLSLSGIEQPKEDIHEWNMKQIFHKVRTREGAKKKFFAWLYNPNCEDKQIQQYYDRVSVLKKYFSNGVLYTPFNRKISTDDFHALNYLLQSSSSDNCITQVNKIHRFLRNKKSNVAFVVHDSIVVDIAHDERHLIPQLKEIFEETKLGNFPVGVKLGKNYGQMRGLKW